MQRCSELETFNTQYTSGNMIRKIKVGRLKPDKFISGTYKFVIYKSEGPKRETNRKHMSGSTHRKIQIGKHKAENSNREIHIGNTGRKIQIGKYMSDNNKR